LAFTTISGPSTMRSGSPIDHAVSSGHWSGAGMSAAFPRGAPLSTHCAIFATSSSESDGSCLYVWMPMFFSMYQGGMAPALSRMLVRCRMARAQGRTSS